MSSHRLILGLRKHRGPLARHPYRYPNPNDHLLPYIDANARTNFYPYAYIDAHTCTTSRSTTATAASPGANRN